MPADAPHDAVPNPEPRHWQRPKVCEGGTNIILTGYMGVGKSTVGRLLASTMAYRFVDTDKLLEKRSGQSIRQLFTEAGETAFRAQEDALLAELLTQRYQIIATGGGTLVRESTWDHIRAAGQGAVRVVYLSAPVALLFERVIFSPKDRPLLDAPDAEAQFYARFAQREPFYQRADITIPTTRGKAHSVADAVLASLSELPTVTLPPSSTSTHWVDTIIDPSCESPSWT